jgi:rhodanese-related sulfurtransferase
MHCYRIPPHPPLLREEQGPPLELLPNPYTLPGAGHFSPEALAGRSHEIPRDRDIVLYRTFPIEATAARTAMTLHKLGIERVLPLRGGYKEWKRLGFSVEPFRQTLFIRPVKA